jgi:hypothetical protein
MSKLLIFGGIEGLIAVTESIVHVWDFEDTCWLILPFKNNLEA